MLKKSILVLFLFLSSVLVQYSTAQNLFSGKEKKQLLSEHNFFRSIVGAKKIIWSKTLENDALVLADKIAQKPISYTNDFDYGLNLYKSSIRPKPELIVKTWADEQIYYNGNTISQKGLLVYQHYTQIIWKQTTTLGCAMSKTKAGTYIVVCFYNPKGNTLGEKP